jgi:hypothetical protein
MLALVSDPATKSDVRELKGLLAELTVMIDKGDRAILNRLDAIQVELADIKAVVEAQIPEGKPDEDDEET